MAFNWLLNQIDFVGSKISTTKKIACISFENHKIACIIIFMALDIDVIAMYGG